MNNRLPYIIAITVAVYYLALKFTRHYSLQTFGFDLSAFDYALANWNHSTSFFTPFFGKSYLSEHFFPSLVLFLPFHLIYPHPETLLCLQALMVAAAGIPFYKGVFRLTGCSISATAFTLAFLMNPWIIKGVAFDFHLEMLQPLAIAMIFYSLTAKRHAVFVFSMIVLLGTKENQWMSTLVLGLVLIFYRGKRVYAVSAILLSLLTCLLVLKVWSDPDRGTALAYYMQRYSPYGTSPFAIAGHFITHPHHMFTVESWTLFIKLILRTGILSILTPLSLPALPEFLVHTLSYGAQQRNLQLYYASAVVPWLFAGSAFGFATIRRVLSNRSALIVSLMIVILSVSFTAPAAVTAESREVIKLIKSIPQGSNVSAENELIPHLKRQKDLREIKFINQDYFRWKYIVLDIRKRESIIIHMDSNSLFQRSDSSGFYLLYTKKNAN
ncbi:MAG: DUF2079 domain-containing protein [Fibrobacteres bacterium]|nr:DUF2079 domain-containing protein [Fibrobacterota bacterium]